MGCERSDGTACNACREAPIAMRREGNGSLSSATAGTLFIDYDGTIHDSARLYEPAFRQVYGWLVDQGWALPQEFSDEFIDSWLGWKVRDMWEAFMPGLPERVWREASQRIGREMAHRLEAGEGVLFDGCEDALTELKQEGYDLVFLSNCGTAYRDVHRRMFGLDQWFSSYFCADDFPGLEKWEIYEKVHDRFAMPQAMIGDRAHDKEVSDHGGIPFIGCAWGYGKPEELDGAAAVATSWHDVPDAVSKVFEAHNEQA